MHVVKETRNPVVLYICRGGGGGWPCPPSSLTGWIGKLSTMDTRQIIIVLCQPNDYQHEQSTWTITSQKCQSIVIKGLIFTKYPFKVAFVFAKDKSVHARIGGNGVRNISMCSDRHLILGCNLVTHTESLRVEEGCLGPVEGTILKTLFIDRPLVKARRKSWPYSVLNLSMFIAPPRSPIGSSSLQVPTHRLDLAKYFLWET